jgi:hypothetical protein
MTANGTQSSAPPPWEAADLWATPGWSQHFGHRPGLQRELALLGRLFTLEWRTATFGVPEPRHQLRGDLLTVGGRVRLLVLAEELLRQMNGGSSASVGSAEGRIPTQGRLRCWSLYLPTRGEFLVAPILRPLGDVIWQPEGRGHGADYQVLDASCALVAEVKHVRTSNRYERTSRQRAAENMGRSGPLFTPDEHNANTREDIPRLCRRVQYAAKQLRTSARNAAGRAGRPVSCVARVLLLDLDENPYLLNLRPTIRRWMNLPWAEPIDLILLFDFASRDGVWGTIVEPIYSRTHRALEVFVRAHGICDRAHFHIGNKPNGPCKSPIGF